MYFELNFEARCGILYDVSVRSTFTFSSTFLQKAEGSKSAESSEAVQRKLNEALLTIRRLHIQVQKLEEEKRKLTETAHEYANTKLDGVERENASLKEKATADQQLITTMSVKLNELTKQKAAVEEKLQSVTASKDILEQKVIGQQATIENVLQVLIVCIYLIHVYACAHLTICSRMYTYIKCIHVS